MGGRQLEPAEAERLLTEREVGPLEGFRSKMGRPFSAKLKLNDANQVEFDFGPRPGDDDGELDFTGQQSLGPCPKCTGRVFETPSSYVCEKAVGPEKTCDFRSGRTILQRPVERAQMEKLLATGKTDLLQFVSARTRRPFSAYLARQPDGKVGFEFEPKGERAGKGGRHARGAPLRVLGKHPKDSAPIELHAGKYGPYVKHGAVNATLPDSDKAETLTLAEALDILAAKTGKPSPAKGRKAAKTAPAMRKGAEEPPARPYTTRKASPAPRPATTRKASSTKTAAVPKVAARTAPKVAPRAPPRARKTARKRAS